MQSPGSNIELGIFAHHWHVECIEFPNYRMVCVGYLNGIVCMLMYDPEKKLAATWSTDQVGKVVSLVNESGCYLKPLTQKLIRVTVRPVPLLLHTK